MNMLTSSLDNIGLADSGIVAGLGYVVVFAGLVALMIVVILIGKFFQKSKNAKTAEEPVAPVAEPVEIVSAEPSQPLAPGAAGQLKLYDTPPKTAAMLMAIVADKMGKPLNELRFISIKDVK